MNYPLLKRDDYLPAVGVLQKLLNSRGAGLALDGSFGNHTHQAVCDVQSGHSLVVDGRVSLQSWPVISSGFTLPIIDFVDVFDPSLYEMEAADIRAAGGNPILMGGISNGVEQMVNMILSSAGSNVFLLRFHGHGFAGIAGMGDGQGTIDWTTRESDGTLVPHSIDANDERSHIGSDNIRMLRPALQRLRPIFGPYGCVQFMHCSTASGPEGRHFVRSMADILGVPVSAAEIDQEGGGLNTFQFEGPTFTAVPHGGTIRTWTRSRPNFIGTPTA